MDSARQLQDEKRIIQNFIFGVPYIKDFMVCNMPALLYKPLPELMMTNLSDVIFYHETANELTQWCHFPGLSVLMNQNLTIDKGISTTRVNTVSLRNMAQIGNPWSVMYIRPDFCINTYLLSSPLNVVCIIKFVLCHLFAVWLPGPRRLWKRWRHKIFFIANVRIPIICYAMWHYIDGLVQEKRNSSALAMELRLSCTNPSI